MGQKLNMSIKPKPAGGQSGGSLTRKNASPQLSESSHSVSVYFEEIRNRAETISPLLKELLDRRPPPHWGINE